MITKKILVWIIVGWCLITLINYYYTNFFILAFIWIGMSLGFFIATIVQIWKAIEEIKSVSKLRITKLFVFVTLFLLTFYGDIPNQLIEKVDWEILKNKRVEIVEKVRTGELEPNVDYNGIICELPFEIPVISNGGNDIWITSNENNNSLTVRFWIFRNFFESPSTMFIYSNNPEEMKRLENISIERPNENWKIESNWFRIKESY